MAVVNQRNEVTERQEMTVKLHRIVVNLFDWQRPSPGRLGADNVGDYVRTNGFGYEDWNFNTNLAEGEYIWGYTAANARRSLHGVPLSLVLATWDALGHWKAVGYYRNAQFVESGPTQISEQNLRQRAEDILALADAKQLGGGYATGDFEIILQLVRGEIQDCKWRVRVSDVFLFTDPIPLPSFPPRRPRFKSSYNLQEDTFADLLNSVGGNPPAGGVMTATEFPEGAILEAIHRRRERNPALVSAAKARFRAKHGRLFCEACGFDFNDVYRDEYIEAHHKEPLSNFSGSVNTTIDDLVMVCANCHRMFHRTRPWLSSIEEFQRFFNLTPNVAAHKCC
jgi:hypothetical protein